MTPSNPSEVAELRRRAEARLSEMQKTQHSQAEAQRMTHDAHRLVQELQIHQFELEIQNEQLEQARAETQEALERYTDLYDFAPAGYFSLDRDGTIRQANLTISELFGVDRSRLVNRRFGLFVAENSRAIFHAFAEKVFASQSRETCEAMLLREGKPSFYARIEARRSDDGQECRAVVVDITERKEAEEEIRRLNKELGHKVARRTTQLKEANIELQNATEANLTERRGAERALSDKNFELQNAAEAKDRFLATMSHELRTPLNHVIGFTELLVDGKLGTLNPKQSEYLETVLDSGNHLLKLINDVLEVAKVKAGKSKLKLERFSLRAAIEEVCGMVQPLAEKKSIQVDLEVAPELGEITLDQREFKQALYNLLSNAAKFSGECARVKILAAPHDEHHFKVSVRDTGIGINSEDLPRLFRPFEQLESGTRRRYEGLGLGLILTQKMVELQGGTIGVESEIGQGSCFTVVMPLVLAEAEQPGHLEKDAPN
jgi:PAS domain S-box-containing protein